MKLEIKNIGNNEATLKAIVKNYYCTVAINDDAAIVKKHDELTESEFKIVAGSLVMAGFLVQKLV